MIYKSRSAFECKNIRNSGQLANDRDAAVNFVSGKQRKVLEFKML